MRTEAEIDNDIKNCKAKLCLLMDEKRQVQNKKRSSRSNSYERQKEIDNLNGEWCRLNLKEGNVVKVKGSRSTRPRLIEKVDRGRIITRMCSIDREGNIISLGTVTEHMHNKITKVLVDGKFVPVKTLRENG